MKNLDFGPLSEVLFFSVPSFLTLFLNLLFSFLPVALPGCLVTMKSLYDLIHPCLERRTLKFALPDNYDIPVNGLKSGIVYSVPFSISKDLTLPELDIGLRKYIVLTSFVTMPEASVYKDCCAVFRKNNVRTSWKLFDIEPEPVAPTEQLTPNLNLRLCALGPDSGHAVMSLLRCQFVSHDNKLKY